MTAENHDELIGTTFAEQYEILGVLGQGGMGVVYKARHKLLDQLVALKVLHKHLSCNQQSIERIRQEGRTAAFLAHPHIVKIRHLGLSDQGQPFLVMDYLEGKTLSEILDAQGPLSLTRFQTIFGQCLSAIAAAHRSGIVHRDLKPGNIMVDRDDRLWVLDFGIAKILPVAPEGSSGKDLSAQSLTQTGALLGSPAYMSPEQCLGQAPDHRSDIYSLGCLMYEALTGRPPFRGTSALDTMYRHLNSSAPDLCAVAQEIRVPPSLADVIFKCLEKNPKDRFQSAEELKEAFDLSFAPLTVRSLTPLKKRGRSRRGKLNITAGISPESILSALIIVAICAWLYLFRLSLMAPKLLPASDKPALIGEQEPPDEPCEPQSATAANQLGLRQKQGNQLQSARVSFEKALLLATREKNPKEAIQAHFGLSDLPDVPQTTIDMHYKQAIMASEKYYKRDSFLHSENLLRYAYWLQSVNRLAEAEAVYKEAKRIRERTLLGPDRSFIAFATHGLALIYVKQGRFKEAEENLLVSLKFRDEAGKGDYWETTATVDDLGHLYMQEKKYSLALPLFKRYFNDLVARTDAVASDEEVAIIDIADCLKLLGKWKESADCYREALDMRDANKGIDKPPLKKLLLDYASVLEHLGRRQEVDSVLKRADEI